MTEIKYKLIDKDGYTRRGLEGETYWLDGEMKIAKGTGQSLCSDDVIHFYDHPYLAVISNPIQANIDNPRLIEIEIDKAIVADGLTGGCKQARFIKEITPPVITLEEKIECGEWPIPRGDKETATKIYEFFEKNQHPEGIEIDTLQNSPEEVIPSP